MCLVENVHRLSFHEFLCFIGDAEKQLFMFLFFEDLVSAGFHCN